MPNEQSDIGERERRVFAGFGVFAWSKQEEHSNPHKINDGMVEVVGQWV